MGPKAVCGRPGTTLILHWAPRGPSSASAAAPSHGTTASAFSTLWMVPAKGTTPTFELHCGSGPLVVKGRHAGRSHWPHGTRLSKHARLGMVDPSTCRHLAAPPPARCACKLDVTRARQALFPATFPLLCGRVWCAPPRLAAHGWPPTAQLVRCVASLHPPWGRRRVVWWAKHALRVPGSTAGLSHLLTGLGVLLLVLR